MILSVLICSLYSRAGMLAALVRDLYEQIEKLNVAENVEILINADSGEKTTGEKRNDLIELSTGMYVVFVDDDDKVMDCYIEESLKAVKERPDVVGINGIKITDGKTESNFFISKSFDESEIPKINSVYWRPTNHLCPIKREIALQIKFPNKTIGEDWEWSQKLRQSGLIKTEVKIIPTIYKYRFNSQK